MFRGNVLREGNNNFSPFQTGDFCLDHTQRMTVLEFSDMNSALAQESSSLRQGMTFLFPYFHCKKKTGVGYGMVVGQFRMWEILSFVILQESLLKIIPGCSCASMFHFLVCPCS